MSEQNRLSELLGACGADPAQDAALNDWLKDWAVLTPRPQAMAALLAASRITAQEVARPAFAPPEFGRRRERWLANGWAVGLAASLMALLMAVDEPAPQAAVDLNDPAVVDMVFSTDLSEGWL